MTHVWLVYNSKYNNDDIVSIWTTEEMAKAAVIFHESKNPYGDYRIKEWQLNVTIPQWG